MLMETNHAHEQYPVCGLHSKVDTALLVVMNVCLLKCWVQHLVSPSIFI